MLGWSSADACTATAAAETRIERAEGAGKFALSDDRLHSWPLADASVVVTDNVQQLHKRATVWTQQVEGIASCGTTAADSTGAPPLHGQAAAQPYVTGLKKHEAPAYVTYPYVLHGYRTGGTYTRCILALFEWHTETLNAWTMVWASCLSVYLLCHALATLDTHGSGIKDGVPATYYPGVPDQLPFWLLTTATLLHAPFSICFHVFRGMSPYIYNLWRRLDQVFIFQVSQILTAGIAWFVYETWWGAALNIAASIVIASLGTRDIWAMPSDYRRNRAHMVVFVGFIALCYWWPMGVQAARDCSVWLWAPAGAASPPAAATYYAIGALASLFAGGLVFASGFPERAFPYVFDIVGFSHQWMHVAVMAAHAFEYAFVLEMWARRQQVRL